MLSEFPSTHPIVHTSATSSIQAILDLLIDPVAADTVASCPNDQSDLTDETKKHHLHAILPNPWIDSLDMIERLQLFAMR